MLFFFIVAAIVALLSPCQGFLRPSLAAFSTSSSIMMMIQQQRSALYMGMNRKSRREDVGKEATTTGFGKKKQPKFIDLMTNQDGKEVKLKLPPNSGAAAEKSKLVDTDHVHYVDADKIEGGLQQKEGYATSPGSAADAPLADGEKRPEVARVVVDPETGMDVMLKGQKVLDLVTGRAVVLSKRGPAARLAQFSPGVSPDARDALRFKDISTMSVSDMLDAFRDACMVDGQIPPHPQVSEKAIDFVIANKDYLGMSMKKVLSQLKMRNQSLNKLDEARTYKKLLRHYILLEIHITAPFRQMVLDAEGKVGPNFGNLDVASYCGGELYERSAAYIVLKAMVAHWEKKVRDADYYTNTPKTKENFFRLLSTGDPRRYLAEPPIIHRLDECVKICARAQQMTAEFVKAPELFNDLSPELRFIEKSLAIQGGTELRRFMIQDFCPQEGITPEGLREGMRRLSDQMNNMSMDPYGDFTILVGKLQKAMAVGSSDEINPYAEYLMNFEDNYENNPGHFETYTFNEEPYSFVRFLDNAEEKEADSEGDDMSGGSDVDVDDLFAGFRNEITNALGITTETQEVNEKPKVGEAYKVPQRRALGRPHETGWLDWLEEEAVNKKDIYESDNWREALQKLD